MTNHRWEVDTLIDLLMRISIHNMRLRIVIAHVFMEDTVTIMTGTMGLM